MTKWKKLSAGSYQYGDTGYFVCASYDEISSDDHYYRTGREMVGRIEWAVVVGGTGYNDGENLNWFDTMREARAEVERLVRLDKTRSQ